VQVVDLDISLLDMPYPVTRKLRVPVAIRLSDLHKLMLAAMPWDNSHLHDFTLGRSLRWVDPRLDDLGDQPSTHKTALSDVMAEFRRKRVFAYIYDMGDNWEHEIKVGMPRDLAEGEPPIALIAAAGACAPDDSGGAPGFDYMLEVAADPAHDDHEEMVEWLGSLHPWNPVADLPLLSERVRKAAARILKRL
jgi:hypothetical protein